MGSWPNKLSPIVHLRLSFLKFLIFNEERIEDIIGIVPASFFKLITFQFDKKYVSRREVGTFLLPISFFVFQS